jgi:disulfide bond formation protein DsbB
MYLTLNSLRALPPRAVFAVLALACVGLLAFGLYLQHVVGLEPCPMCIVQRYAMICIAVLSALAWFISRQGLQVVMSLLLLLTAGFGAFVAARQSYLQWYPPEVASCGRDFYGMIESFPLQRAIPMIFKGSGDCTQVDWTFLGGSIANWSFVCFIAMGVLLIVHLARLRQP